MAEITKCTRCDGTGWMCLEDFFDILERDGVPPIRAFGCPKCEGLGEIEAPDDDEYAAGLEIIRQCLERS